MKNREKEKVKKKVKSKKLFFFIKEPVRISMRSKDYKMGGKVGLVLYIYIERERENPTSILSTVSNIWYY